MPIGANAGLLWGPHLSDYQSVDLFSAEIPHRAEGRRFTDMGAADFRLYVRRNYLVGDKIEILLLREGKPRTVLLPLTQ